jgi:lactate dehydrogenase-like 2-hydroxyacid dehydrogenase
VPLGRSFTLLAALFHVRFDHPYNGFIIGVRDTFVTAGLVEALRSGTIVGAALDVYEEEPYDGPLTDLPAEQILLTPHVASNTAEARQQMEAETVANLIKGLQACNAI